MKDKPMDKLLKKALKRCIGMARGVVVLDENLYELEKSLELSNIRVVTPDPGMDDKSIAKKLASGRILITKNSKDFLKFAPIYDIGIISLENLKFIDTAQDDTNQTVALISDIMMEANLWSKRCAFLVNVKADGSYSLKDLE